MHQPSVGAGLCGGRGGQLLPSRSRGAPQNPQNQTGPEREPRAALEKQDGDEPDRTSSRCLHPTEENRSEQTSKQFECTARWGTRLRHTKKIAQIIKALLSQIVSNVISAVANLSFIHTQ